MNLSKKQTLLVLGLTTLIFWSCTKEQVCDENTTSAVNFAILNKTTNSTIETRLYYIVNDDDATDTLFHSRNVITSYSIHYTKLYDYAIKNTNYHTQKRKKFKLYTFTNCYTLKTKRSWILIQLPNVMDTCSKKRNNFV